MKLAHVGIRREDKNPWEKRVPLVPEDIRPIIKTEGMQFTVQPSQDHRAFGDGEYSGAGARIDENLKDCDIIFGVKEIPVSKLIPAKTHIFFAHVIKGQPYNMPMLKALIDQKCSLIDYEKIEDAQNRRLIFFGRHAGLAGMVETLHALGQRLLHQNIPNPFSSLNQPYRYHSLAHIRAEMALLGDRIRTEGLPGEISPVIVGISGYGNVSKGAQEILDILPHVEVQPSELLREPDRFRDLRNAIVKVVFYEKDMFRPKEAGHPFDLREYFSNPEIYCSRFEDYLPLLTVLVNCIYWTPQYPRLVTKAYLKRVFSGSQTPRLRVVGDISCDIDGSIEATMKSTQVDQPSFVYDPLNDSVMDGTHGRGLVIMAIDNLPCEISRDASIDFSQVLSRYVRPIAGADFTAPFERLDLPDEIKRAVIVYNGELTERYCYIQKFLDKYLEEK